MTISIRAALIAPIPFFLLLLIGLVEPSFGWTDAVFSVGVSAACSYGFMFVAGLPTHFILRRFGWQSWAHYVCGFLMALIIVVILFTTMESPPLPPLPHDSSPFEQFSLRDGGWMLVLAFFSPIAALMALLFWYGAVRSGQHLS